MPLLPVLLQGRTALQLFFPQSGPGGQGDVEEGPLPQLEVQPVVLAEAELPLETQAGQVHIMVLVLQCENYPSCKSKRSGILQHLHLMIRASLAPCPSVGLFCWSKLFELRWHPRLWGFFSRPTPIGRP